MQLTENVDWLDLNPAGGNTPFSVGAWVDCSLLADGETKNTTIQVAVAPPGLGSVTIQVTTEKALPSPNPTMQVSSTQILGLCPSDSTAVIDLVPQVDISSSDVTQNFDVSLEENTSWLNLTNVVGTVPFSVVFQGDCSQLANGETVQATIQVTAQAPGTGTASIQVTLQKGNAPPTLSLSSTFVSGVCPADGVENVTLTPDVTVSSTDGNLDFPVTVTEAANWLQVTASDSGTPLNLVAVGDCSQIANGARVTTSITLTGQSPGIGSATIAVSLRKDQPPPTPSLNFTAIRGTCSAGSMSTISLSPDVTISSSDGSQNFLITLLEAETWLQLSSIGGNTPLNMTATGDCSQVASGTFVTTTIQVTAQSPGTGSAIIDVTLQKDAAPGPTMVMGGVSRFWGLCASDSTRTMDLCPTGFCPTISSSDPGVDFPVTLAESADWLRLQSTSATTPMMVTATGNCSQLSPGQIVNTTVDVTAEFPGAGTESFPVELRKALVSPVLVLSDTTVQATCAADNTALITFSPTLDVTGSLASPDFPFRVITSDPWLSVNELEMSTPTTFIVSASCADLNNGETRAGTLTFEALDPGSGTVILDVLLDKQDPPIGTAALLVNTNEVSGVCEIDGPLGVVADPHVFPTSSDPSITFDISFTPDPLSEYWFLPIVFGPHQTGADVWVSTMCDELAPGQTREDVLEIHALFPGTGVQYVTVRFSKPYPDPFLVVNTVWVEGICPAGSTQDIDLTPVLQITSDTPGVELEFGLSPPRGWLSYSHYSYSSNWTPFASTFTGHCSQIADGETAYRQLSAYMPAGNFGPDSRRVDIYVKLEKLSP